MPYADPEKQAAYQREHYQKNKSVWNERNRRKRDAARKYRDAFKKASGCLFCGARWPELPLTAFHFHHVDRRTKRGRVSNARSLRWLKQEIARCVVLCVECHNDYHYQTDIRSEE